ncbi:hypothetical protein C2S51_023273 [Perilla frutescens var. frutescens]|nr:hypothetical protein C2S51_023273 [Perilla frutescens var. frutescens]
MASLQVDASPLEDVITETEATSKEPQTAAPAPALPPPENVKTLDVEDEDDLEDLTAPPYAEKVGNSDDEEDKDAEYSSFMEREEAAPPFNYAGGPASFDDFNEDDDPEDEDDA